MIYKNSEPTKSKLGNEFKIIRSIVILTCTSLIFFTTIKSAMAHHPIGGRTSANFWEGLLSRMGHPIIGIDRLAFVVAVGLIAATIPNSINISIFSPYSNARNRYSSSQYRSAFNRNSDRPFSSRFCAILALK